MPDADRYCTVVSTPTFEASAKGVLEEADRRELEVLLAEEPHRGAIVPRTGGFRKLRFARPTRTEGKSGGVRVVYYFVDREELVFLILVYAKNRKDDLTPAEENVLKKIAKELKGEA